MWNWLNTPHIPTNTSILPNFLTVSSTSDVKFSSFVTSQETTKIYNKGRSPYNGRLSDVSFYIDSQISVHRKFKK